MKTRILWIFGIIVLVFTFLSANAFAAEYVRLRTVEGEVAVYTPAGTEEATINTPLMDGDEVQTGDGRAELSFRNGITVRIGDYSGIRLESSYTPMRIEILQGTIFVDSHIIDRFSDELMVRAGDAEVYLIDEGNMRIDLGTEGAVRVTSVEGQVEVEAGGSRVLLNSGERTYVDPGTDPSEPELFRGELDELDEWNESRMDYYARGDYDRGSYGDYVDEDIYYDAYDLGGYGDWRYMGTYGYVWIPHVEYGWRPYYDGRWSYYNNSWFWISYEPWGWAPYHYGRWGWSLDFGWYWIPGNVFGPSWVSWYSYGDYIGWCPLSYYNYPIFYHHDFFRYPRIHKEKTLNIGNSWTFVKKNDLGVRDIKRAVLKESTVRNLKIDKARTSTSPRKELVSYVLPKTKQAPAWVNDKRIVKQPGDIKSPIGKKQREEQFERPGSKVRSTPGVVEKGKGAERSIDKGKSVDRAPDKSRSVNRSFDRSPKAPVRVEPKKSVPKQNNQSNLGRSIDRDSQFKRNESNKRYNSPYANPYYKGNRTYDRNDSGSKSKISPWSRGPSNDSQSRREDVSPRYRDEAKKYFERFEHKNLDRSAPRSYERSPQRNYEPSPRNYEPPKRNYEPQRRSYEAPKRSYEPPKRSYEAPRREYKAPSSSNSNRRPSGNSNSNNNRKRNN